MKKFQIESSKKYGFVVWDTEQIVGFVFNGTIEECREYCNNHGKQIGIVDNESGITNN